CLPAADNQRLLRRVDKSAAEFLLPRLPPLRPESRIPSPAGNFPSPGKHSAAETAPPRKTPDTLPGSIQTIHASRRAGASALRVPDGWLRLGHRLACLDPNRPASWMHHLALPAPEICSRAAQLSPRSAGWRPNPPKPPALS